MKSFFGDGITLLDGAMGTLVQKEIGCGISPELLNLTAPDSLTALHRRYVEAGSDVIYTFTFGANARKLPKGTSVGEVIAAAIKNARAATVGTSCKVALDVGPLGALLKPVGSLSFDEAYALFSEQIKAGKAADLIAIETMADLNEARAALLAAKENSDLPVICTMTFEGERTYLGCEPRSAALTLEALGADAVGVNCSAGPDALMQVVSDILSVTSIPVIVKANAGLPDEKGNYSISPEGFAEYYRTFVDMGVSVLGGCCGTTPEYIKKLNELKAVQPKRREIYSDSAVCSSRRFVPLDRVRIIGERLNPTGKKLLKQALIDGDFDYLSAQAVSQVERGADILDLNCGVAGIDETDVLGKATEAVTAAVDAPLQIDSGNSAAIERALRSYPGVAIVNSVNGSEKSMEEILPLVKKYGACVVGLTLDEKGIPKDAAGRIAIAKRIADRAMALGIPKSKLFFDTLTLTVSAEQQQAKETLAALSHIKNIMGYHTVLGVSNISFGLPNRENINNTFLVSALHSGLSMPIMNPDSRLMTDSVLAYNALSGADVSCSRYIEAFSGTVEIKASATETTIAYAVEKGLTSECGKKVAALLDGGATAIEIINGQLIPALNLLGDKFEKGTAFLPQLISGAEAAKAGFTEIKKRLGSKAEQNRGEIVLATVQGDVHDIGKSIVKVILENYGYSVVDLGKDVPPERILTEAKERKLKLLGLSALMTTTLPSMEKTIALIKTELPNCRIMVGGAVLTAEYARKIGADYYCKDSMDSVRAANTVYNQY